MAAPVITMMTNTVFTVTEKLNTTGSNFLHDPADKVGTITDDNTVQVI
ncbi:MAG TPA: hypothetical protein VMF90_00375 [Rhizobiaceae bacterium]|nr:hypothetical protein [Rhizobiaceae bacterium]